MYIKSLIKYLSFRDKIRFAAIDLKYRESFLSNERPPKYFYDKALEKQDIVGLETILLFHTNVHTMEKVNSMLRRAFNMCKIKVLRWLLDREMKSVPEDKRYFLSDINRLFRQCMYGASSMNKRLFKFVKKLNLFRGEDISTIIRNIEDVIRDDDVKKFSNMYKSLPHTSFSFKNLLPEVKRNGSKKIYKWLYMNVGFSNEFMEHSNRLDLYEMIY